MGFDQIAGIIIFSIVAALLQTKTTNFLYGHLRKKTYIKLTTLSQHIEFAEQLLAKVIELDAQGKLFASGWRSGSPMSYADYCRANLTDCRKAVDLATKYLRRNDFRSTRKAKERLERYLLQIQELVEAMRHNIMVSELRDQERPRGPEPGRFCPMKRNIFIV